MNWSQIEERWRRQATRPAELEVERSLLLGRMRTRSAVGPTEAKRPFGGWSAATETRATPSEQSNDQQANRSAQCVPKKRRVTIIVEPATTATR